VGAIVEKEQGSDFHFHFFAHTRRARSRAPQKPPCQPTLPWSDILLALDAL